MGINAEIRTIAYVAATNSESVYVVATYAVAPYEFIRLK
jgi:hypothetical protein